MNSDRKEPTSSWCESVILWSGTIVNIDGPHFMSPGLNSHIRPSIKVRSNWPSSVSCWRVFHGIGPDPCLTSSHQTASKGGVEPSDPPCYINWHVRQLHSEANTCITWQLEWWGRGYRVGVCIVEVMQNKGCDLVGYDWCSIFCRRNGVRLACVRVHVCAT